MGFLRTGEPLTKMIYLIFNIVVSIILSKSTVLLIAKIGTKEDEESGVLMGFWRSLSGSRLRPAGRCQLTALRCNIFSTGGVLSRVEWSEQPVDGQVSGPQVFRKSDHLPHPLPPSPHPQPKPSGELGRGNNRAATAAGVNHLVLQLSTLSPLLLFFVLLYSSKPPKTQLHYSLM